MKRVFQGSLKILSWIEINKNCFVDNDSHDSPDNLHHDLPYKRLQLIIASKIFNDLSYSVIQKN